MSEAEDARQDLQQLLADGCRVLAHNGHDDYVWGHISVRDPMDAESG